MKKLLIIFTFLLSFILPANADVMPYYVNNINTNSIGVYQASNHVRIYKEPNENSPLLLDVFWDNQTFNCPDISASNLFVVFLPKKELAFLTVTDENDNENWVEVVYNRNGSQKGWVKKDDEYRFMSWRTFFNLYGRKYGLYYMKDAPKDTKVIYSSNAEGSQELGKITMPQTVKLTSVKGNWLLVVAFDVDRLQKIGWIKWRSIAGEIYLFPDIK
ncbi:MAG: hypothetical protein WCY19_02505 [Candidatus Gastranaerophilaceae bacterium]